MYLSDEKTDLAFSMLETTYGGRPRLSIKWHRIGNTGVQSTYGTTFLNLRRLDSVRELHKTLGEYLAKEVHAQTH